ncbi:MAG: hypothetical protein Q8936_10820 [Bacillota bacterium]|nr:hypothetical protein [Bacillota bacterium]
MSFIFQAVQDVQDVQENKTAIERLISEYSKDLTRLRYMLLKDAHLAEEVTPCLKKH